MHEFTLKNPKKMGERDEKYGQSYWSYTHESQMPVKFNLMQGDVFDDQKIQCEEYSVKKSQKGTDYQQLKKVRVVGAPTSSPTTTKKEWQPRDDSAIKAQWSIGQAVSVYGDKVDEVEAFAKTLFEMVERVKKGKGAEGSPEPVDEVHEVDETVPINLDDIPF